jgi:hypothetical protein
MARISLPVVKGPRIDRKRETYTDCRSLADEVIE